MAKTFEDLHKKTIEDVCIRFETKSQEIKNNLKRYTKSYAWKLIFQQYQKNLITPEDYDFQDSEYRKIN